MKKLASLLTGFVPTFKINLSQKRLMQLIELNPTMEDSDSSPAPWGGAFRGRAPEITACVYRARNVPPSEDCAPKESNRPRATEVHFGAYAPRNTACAPQAS